MAQKSNPISLRLKKTNKLWNSCWYGDYNYTQQLLQDRGVSAYIQNICQQAKMAPPVVFLNRQRQQTSTFFFFSRQQRINRLKRLSRVLSQRSARTGESTWLHKLLFWSFQHPVQTPSVVNNNPAPDVPANSSKKNPPHALLPYGVPYFLHSQKAQRRSEKPITPRLQAEKGGQKPPSTLHLSPPRECSLGLASQFAQAGETRPQGQLAYGTACYASLLILSLLKKKNSSSRTRTQPPFPQPAITGTPAYALLPSGVTLQKTWQQDWGFFAMCSQYSAGVSFRVAASAGRLTRSRSAIPAQVRSQGVGFPGGRSAASGRAWLRNHLESCISAQTHHNSTLHFLLCPSVHQNPLFLAAQLTSSLENRKTFRRLKDRLIQDISADSSIKGVRITCSGRVAARSKKAQKARTESIQWGQTSLNVFSDLVNFASKSALTPFGKIGVKVWICYREIKKKN